MNVLRIIFLYFALINGNVFVQSQFALWSGTFSIVNTDTNVICNQTACCCLINPIIIAKATSTITLTSNVNGIGCSGSTNTSAIFALPSGFIIDSADLGIEQADNYIVTLSSDSNTLTINDTTNEQCTSVAQRVTFVSTTIVTTVSTITPTATMVNTKSSVVPSTSSSTNGSDILGFNLFLCLLASLIAYTLGN